MFNKKFLYIILLMLLGGTMSAHAQLALSLDECIRIALNENPTIKVQEMEITRRPVPAQPVTADDVHGHRCRYHGHQDG